MTVTQPLRWTRFRDQRPPALPLGAWFWVSPRRAPRRRIRDIVWVYAWDDGPQRREYVYATTTWGAGLWRDRRGWWAGPIPEPEEPAP